MQMEDHLREPLSELSEASKLDFGSTCLLDALQLTMLATMFPNIHLPSVKPICEDSELQF